MAVTREESTRLAVLERFRVWWARAIGSNALVRRTDRVQALLVLFAFAVSVLAVPYSADARSSYYTEAVRTIDSEIAARHQVDAVAIADSTTSLNRYSSVTSVQARWVANATPRTGVVQPGRIVQSGDHFPMWLDTDGNLVEAPRDASAASRNATAASVSLWLSIAAACATLVLVSGLAFNRHHRHRWDRDLQQFAGNDEGHADRRA